MADCGCPGAPWLFVRTRGPLTPRRLLLSSPPTLEWVLLGVPSRKTPTPRGPLLVRRGEVLPETGTVVLDTRPTLQGILGPHTCISRIEVKGDCMGRRGDPQHREEKEGVTQGEPQHSEKGGGSQGRPQHSEEEGVTQGGPQLSEKRGGSQGGSQHNEKEGVIQGGPQHNEKEGVIQGEPQHCEKGVTQGEPQHCEKEGTQGRPQHSEEEGVTQGGPQHSEKRGGSQGGSQHNEKEGVIQGGPQHNEKEGVIQGGPQHSEKEGGTQRDQERSQHNEKEGGTREDQGGPQHRSKDGGTQRDQGGPQLNEKEWSTQRGSLHSKKEGGTQEDQEGPQLNENEGSTQRGSLHSKNEGGTQRDHGGLEHGDKEGSTQEREEGNPREETSNQGGPREDQGNQRDQGQPQEDQGGPWEEQRGEEAIEENGRGGLLEEESLSWGGQREEESAPSSDSLLVGSSVSFLDISSVPPDLHSPLVSSFARTPLPLRLRVAPIDAESLVRSGRLQEVGGPVDRSAALWVSRKQLRALGLYHREWVWVSLLLDKRKAVAHAHGGRHLAMILAAELWLGHPHKYNHLLSSPCLAARDEPTYPGSVPAGTAVISATLAFNLTSGSGSVSEVLIQRFSTEPTREGRSALVEPPVATLLHVDVVKSPAYSSDATFQQALYQHFQTPRAVQVGDVLCVSSLSHSEFQLNKSQVPVRCPDLYFKVRKLEGEQASEGYLANTTHTTLYQVGSVCSFVPSFPSRDGHVFWSSLFPAGLSHAVDDICRILLPHLQNTSDVLGAGGRILLTGPKGGGKITVVQAACSRMNLHLYQVECARLCRDSSASSISRLRSVFSRAQDCPPCVLLLSHLDLLGKDKDGSGEDTRVLSALCSLLLGTSHTNRELPFLVVATTSRIQEVPVDLQSCFLHEVSLSAPTEEQRLSLLTALTAPLPLSRDVDLAHLARRTAGFVVGDLCALLSRAGRISCTRIRNSCAPSEEDEEGLLAAGFPVTSQDLDCALGDLQAAHSEAIGAPKVPCVHWSDVGGLEDAKRQLLDTVQFPLEHPEMLALGLTRSGILLYGPPGTGKTLLAKAVATECAMTFLSVKGPELINMYVGQSEENVREVFSRAQAASPCIIFFDELDSLAPNRGRSGDSGGVMDRVVSQLLAEMDGLHSSSDVFVIGATNRPDLLDPALLRPGRFDRLVYVGLNEDRESQQKVLEAITRKFSLHPSVDLSHVLQYCPAALTGADLYALCANAMMSSIKEKVQRLQEGADEPVTALVLRLEHLVQAAQHLQPSVSPQELQRYERIHRQFSMTSDDV